MASNAQPQRRAPPSDAPLDPNERTSPSTSSIALGRPTAAAALRSDAPADLPLLGEDHLLPLPPALAPAGEEARLKQSQDEEESRKRRAQSEENEGENCIICLQEVRDRTVIVTCGHDHFCFNCIGVWADQSRKCPLCSRPMGEYLLHDLQSPFPHVKYFLPPFAKPSTIHPQHPVLPPPIRRFRPRRNDRAPSEDGNDFERRLEKRREIYRWGLYAKHVASNPTTRYKPAPTPAQFASNPDLISRAQVFLRRELQVWTGVDIEFMVTYVISLMQSIDIRSDAAVRLLRDFLDVGFEDVEEGGGRAEHFAHEVYSFIRSPFRDLKLYDAAVSYDAPPTSTAASSSRRLSTSRNRPARNPTAQARLASAFEDLVDGGAGGLGEALGDRAPASRVDDGYLSSESKGSSRSSHGGRGRARSRSRDGRSIRSGSRSVSRSPRNRSESRDPSPRPTRVGRRRSLSPRGRHPGPPLSPRRWNVYDSWISPDESERQARARSANRGARRPPARYDDRPTRREDDRPAPSGRRALPDQGAVFDQRPVKMPRLGGGPLGERRGPLLDRRPPPSRPSTQEHVQADPLGGGMRAWSINDAAPVIAIDSDVAPEEADAHANLPRLLTRISGVDSSIGLQINGRAKGRNNGLATNVRGAARPSATGSSEESSTRPTPVVKAKGAPRNVLLQRLAGALAESKADALRASARSVARASDPQSQPPAASSERASSDSVTPEVAAPVALSSFTSDPAPVKQAPARKKPDVSNLKSRILERLQAEKLKAGEGPSKVVDVADGQQASDSAREETEEQVLRRQLQARRKA